MSKIIFPIIIFVLAAFFIYRTWTNHKAGEENFAIGQTFLLENGKKEGVITTESGLQYEVLHKGEGDEKPTASSKVKVHYHGTLIDGTVFDSSVDRGQPISFKLNQVIKGWQEGLTYMSVGDKFRLYIPSPLAYGKNGSGPIPPASALIFDVELLEIQ
jgi:peptidylprolyl isomerase